MEKFNANEKFPVPAPEESQEILEHIKSVQEQGEIKEEKIESKKGFVEKLRGIKTALHVVRMVTFCAMLGAGCVGEKMEAKNDTGKEEAIRFNSLAH